MAALLGEVLYWTAIVIAGLIVASVAAGSMSNASEGLSVIAIIPLLLQQLGR